jgi:hypothetical protein
MAMCLLLLDAVMLTVFGLTLLPRAVAAQYLLMQDFSGSNFFSNFDFFTEPDPTNGFVKCTSSLLVPK